MVEVAEIFRAHGPEYLAKYADRMPRAHLRAMGDIEACRTPELGGQLFVCKKCDEYRYSYHSGSRRDELAVPDFTQQRNHTGVSRVMALTQGGKIYSLESDEARIDSSV